MLVLFAGCSTDIPTVELHPTSPAIVAPETPLEQGVKGTLRRYLAAHPDAPNESIVPSAYWSPEIHALDSQQVYLHNGNVVIVRKHVMGTEEGLYVLTTTGSASFEPGVDGFTVIRRVGATITYSRSVPHD
jgi:hypothetical protein